MVCPTCNGKEYVIEKHRESVCDECRGRGGFFFGDREKSKSQESQQVNAGP
jgi:DnaJ-class molecular chaperone